MSVSPVNLNGMIQRTNDVGNAKQIQDSKPLIDQANIQQQVIKKEDQLRHQVMEPDTYESLENNMDAKEEGSNNYFFKKSQKRKKQDNKKTKNHQLERQRNKFDITI